MKMIDEADFDYEKFGFNEKIEDNGIVVSSMEIDNENCDFKKGSYKIVSCKNLFIAPKNIQRMLEEEIVKQLKSFLMKLEIYESDTILVCGLGNGEIVADSFGEKTCKKVLATKLLNKKIVKSNVCTLCPNVQAVTGIKTFDIVCGVAKQIKAKLIVLIDSFLTNNIKRLGHSFQMSDTGIIPGGALNFNKEISYDTTNIKCITIGVPFMLNLKEIANCVHKDIIVSPKDIKFMVEKCSTILANSLNKVFSSDLKRDEIMELLNPI